MTEEVCSTCGQPMAGHRCPVLPTGAVVRGTAVIPAVRKADCPHCGKVGGHNNDTANAVAFKCAWAQFEAHQGCPLVFSAGSVDEFCRWLFAAKPDWAAASKPRGHKHTSAPASAPTAKYPTCTACGAPTVLGTTGAIVGLCPTCDGREPAAPVVLCHLCGADCTTTYAMCGQCERISGAPFYLCPNCNAGHDSAHTGAPTTVAAAPAPAEDETARKKRLKAALAGASRLI